MSCPNDGGYAQAAKKTAARNPNQVNFDRARAKQNISDSHEMWTKFLPQYHNSAENEYLLYYIDIMEELTAFGWINSEGQMDLPPTRRSGFVDVLGSYIDNCIMPLRRMYSWGIPADEALTVIENVSPAGIVEVGAGTGYWAMLLKKRGVDIVAYDRTPVQGQLWER